MLTTQKTGAVNLGNLPCTISHRKDGRKGRHTVIVARLPENARFSLPECPEGWEEIQSLSGRVWACRENRTLLVIRGRTIVLTVWRQLQWFRDELKKLRAE